MIDFQAAYIQGKEIDREVYLRPPPDVRARKPNMVWRVIKKIYGFKDAGRGFWLCLDEELIKYGMEKSTMDRALYFMRDSSGEIIGVLCTHCDDLIFVGNEEIKRGEHNHPTFNQRSVMLFGAISTDGKSELSIFQGNVDAVGHQEDAKQR